LYGKQGTLSNEWGTYLYVFRKIKIKLRARKLKVIINLEAKRRAKGV